jgi:hypothetical protein
MIEPPMEAAPLDFQPVDRTRFRRLVLLSVVRVVIGTALLAFAYIEVPLGKDANAVGVVLFIAAILAFGIALGFQVRRIIDAPIPRLRAAETLGIAVPAFIVIFSAVYVALSDANPANFSEPISKLSAVYFTVTVLATVGFGDIAARTDSARSVVTVQMLLDLVLIGVLVKVVVGASRVGVERRRAEAQARGDDEAGPATPS